MLKLSLLLLWFALFFPFSWAQLDHKAILAQARSLKEKKQYSHALEQYERVLKKYPDLALGRWERAEVLYLSGEKPEKVALSLVPLLKVKPYSPDVYHNYIGFLLMGGKFQKARKFWESYESRFSKNFGSFLNAGHSYFFTGEQAKSHEYYKKTFAFLDQTKWSTVVSDFELFIQNGWKVKECREKLQWFQIEWQKIKNVRNHQQANFSKCQTLFQEGKFSQVILEVPQILQKEKSSQIKHTPEALIFLYNFLGNSYQKLRRYNEAIATHKSSLAISQKLHSPHLIVIEWQNILLCHYELGHYEKALFCNKQSEKILPSQPVTYLEQWNKAQESIWYHYGLLEQLQGEEEKAEKSYQRALQFSLRTGSQTGVARIYSELGDIEKNRFQYEKALQLYERALNKDLQQKNFRAAILRWSRIVELLRSREKYDQALLFCEKAFKLKEKIEGFSHIESIWNTKALIYQSRGNYSKALSFFKKAIEIAQKYRFIDKEITFLNNLAILYIHTGEYQKAQKTLVRALSFAQKINDPRLTAMSYNNLGHLNQKWHELYAALEFLKKAEKIAKNRFPQQWLLSRTNQAVVYFSLGDKENSLNYLLGSLQLAEKYSLLSQKADILNRLAHMLYFDRGQIEEALLHVQKAISINKKLGRQKALASDYDILGTIFAGMGEEEKTLRFLGNSLRLAKEVGNKELSLQVLAKLGKCYLATGEKEKAIDFFLQAKALLEELKKHVSEEMQINYRSNYYRLFQDLIYTYFLQKDYRKAYQEIEELRGQFLVENLSFSPQKKAVSLETLQKQLHSQQAVVLYTSLLRGEILPLVITKNRVSLLGKSLKKIQLSSYTKEIMEAQGKKFIESDIFLNKPDIHLSIINKREFVLLKQKIQLEIIIRYYISLLGKRSLDEKEKKLQVKLSSLLYKYLFSALEKEISDKKDIIIIPDGLLYFLAFETLENSEGEYLVSRYNIRYAPSATALSLLNKRKFSEKRKNFLGFGGARYFPTQNSETNIFPLSEEKRGFFREKIRRQIAENKSLKSTYQKLSLDHWSPLPGTIREIKGIQSLVERSSVLLGGEVNEEKIKTFSREKTLTDYRILHFATHGVVVDGIPELSAIVLSQNRGDNEDGYLCLDEIRSLQLRSDLVVLSACQSGIGKIYPGEGMVGLTHAFLQAGSNGVCASLWNISDKGTAKFMVEFYKELNRGKSYPQAITNVKRKFIRGKFGQAYRSPYYWAPFVYSGKRAFFTRKLPPSNEFPWWGLGGTFILMGAFFYWKYLSSKKARLKQRRRSRRASRLKGMRRIKNG